MGFSDVTVEAKWFFQFAFCAVSLAIVWGTTLERIKFGVYVIYAIMFAAIIYPIGAHWVFGGGWLQANIGMQDFAGSTAVHLIGATGGLAVLLLLGARKGKYGGDGKPRPIPGHNDAHVRARRADPVAGLVRVQPGFDPGRPDGRFAEVAAGHAARLRGRCDRRGDHQSRHPEDARHRHGRQRRDRGAGRDHGSVRLRRGVGGPLHRGSGRRPRRAGDPGDRQADRRSRRRSVGARPGRRLGHAVVRDLRRTSAVRVQRVRSHERRRRVRGRVPVRQRPDRKGANAVPGRPSTCSRSSSSALRRWE